MCGIVCFSLQKTEEEEEKIQERRRIKELFLSYNKISKHIKNIEATDLCYIENNMKFVKSQLIETIREMEIILKEIKKFQN